MINFDITNLQRMHYALVPIYITASKQGGTHEGGY
jgi:hypothetical protein